jgi:transcription initiation factor IIE alpha subunit
MKNECSRCGKPFTLADNKHLLYHQFYCDECWEIIAKQVEQTYDSAIKQLQREVSELIIQLQREVSESINKLSKFFGGE